MKELTDKNFNETIESGKPVIVDFWAPWCGPCRMVGPILEQISEERNDVEIAKCNVDENPKSAQQFGIRSIPTVIFFKEGKLQDTMIGASPKAKYEAKIDALYEHK